MCSSLIIPITIALVAILVYTIYSFFQSRAKAEQERIGREKREKREKEEQEEKQKRKPAKKVDITATNRRSSDATKPKEEEHKEMVLQLKGHQGHVTGFGFSSTGKHAATSSEDGTLRIWTLNDLVTRNIPFATIKCQFDHATAIALSGDARYLVAAMNQSKELHIYELKHETTSHRITNELVKTIKTPYKDTITSLAITADGAAVVTCAEGQDTQCYVYGIRGAAAGQLIHTITTAQIINYRVSGSADGKFVAFATKLSDVKIYELTRKKANPSEIASVDLAMTLKGHKRSVKGVAFGPGNEVCATASIDGSWRTFAINVRYGQAEDAKLKHLQQTEFPALELIAISPNPKQPILAVTSDATLAFYHTGTGAHLGTVPHVHRHAVSHLTFHPSGTHVATSSNATNTVNFFKVPTI